MSAISRPTLVADAKPTVTSDRTAKHGIGASIARNKLTQTTDASIAAKSTLLGNGALQSNALSQETITTTSTTGAEGGSSINAGVGIAVVDSNVSSTIGSGNALNLTGPVQIIANRTGTIATTVDGTTVGQTAARGGSFALNDVQSQVLAQVDRSIHSTGNVDILPIMLDRSLRMPKRACKEPEHQTRRRSANLCRAASWRFRPTGTFCRCTW